MNGHAGGSLDACGGPSGGDRLLKIDCGAFQGRRAAADGKNRVWRFGAEEKDAVVLTHAHFDHYGRVPLLRKEGFGGNI